MNHRTGAVVPNAKVTVTGPTGERVATANETGDFEFTNLIPGKYNIDSRNYIVRAAAITNARIEAALELIARTMPPAYRSVR